MQIAPRSVPAWLRFVIYKSYPSDWPKSSSARFSPCHLGGTSSCMGHPWSRPPALLATFETWPIWATINIYRKCFPLRSKQQGHLFSPGINIQTTHCPSIFPAFFDGKSHPSHPSHPPRWHRSRRGASPRLVEAWELLRGWRLGTKGFGDDQWLLVINVSDY